MNTSKSITKTDLTKIETSLKKLIKATKNNRLEQEHLDLLNQLSTSVNELRILVEFDHEKRIQAIEEYLQQI